MNHQPVSSDLISKVQHYAESVLNQLPGSYHYHNTDHTRRVVIQAEAIGRATGLADHALENAIIAAWLHDVGYAAGGANHEEHSKDMARTLLEDLGLPAKRIAKIIACIDATRMPQNPQNEKEMVVCDADLSHLAASDFAQQSENLRQELNAAGPKMGRKKWLRATQQFMEQHHYFTAYAQQTFDPLKQQNLEQVRLRLAELDAETKPAQTYASQPADAALPPPDLTQKSKRSDRGIDTMFRTTSANHLQLSVMADTKANIMISINAIIVSLVLSVLLRKLEDWPALILPTILLTVVCLMATIFAVLAVRPSITSGRFTKESVEEKQANLLFFGNFYRMELAEYEWGMREMMNDTDYLYGSMIHDIYYLGRVLGSKYKFLRLSYNVFMFGFVASVLAFGIAIAFSN